MKRIRWKMKIRNFDRIETNMSNIDYNIRYIKKLFNESRVLQNKIYNEFISKNLDVPNEVKDYSNYLKDEFSIVDSIDIHNSIMRDVNNRIVFISLNKGNGIKVYDRDGNEIVYDIIEGKLCTVLKD